MVNYKMLSFQKYFSLSADIYFLLLALIISDMALIFDLPGQIVTSIDCFEKAQDKLIALAYNYAYVGGVHIHECVYACT